MDAVALLQEVGDRRFEGVAYTARATLERRAGRMEAAARLLEEGTERLEEVGDRLHLALGVCERGHLALARGMEARPELETAAAEAGDLGVAPASELMRAVQRLRRAIEAAASGEVLWCGERPEDVPEGLLRALQG